MDYTFIIKRATTITWQYKFLWIFGIIISLCGQVENNNFNFRSNYNLNTSPGNPPNWPPEFPSYFPEPLGQTPIALVLAMLIGVILIWGLIGLVATAICRAALIKSINRIEEEESISLGQSWQDGLAKALPLGALQAIFQIPLLLLIIAVLVTIFTQFWPVLSQLFTYKPDTKNPAPPPFMQEFLQYLPAFFALMFCFVCFNLVMQLLMSIFITFGSRAIILEQYSVFGSFARTLELLRQNIGATVLLGLIDVMISVVIGMMIAVPAIIVMLLLMISTLPGLGSPMDGGVEFYVLIICVSLGFFLVSGMVMGVVQVFHEALWTLSYREFMQKSEA